jgi:outer membrane protein assembly factor BamB
VGGKRMKCGTRIWSLYDQSLLYMINGADDLALRPWRAFDCSPLVDGDTDTLFTVGENGILYSVKLNTRINSSKVAIDPKIDRYLYSQAEGGKIGSENSLAIYNNYAYFATNVCIIQCVDLNTMKLVWSFDAKDDIDASLVIEVTPDSSVGLYAANELDTRGSKGTSQMFKLNALTGELLWVRNSDPIYQNDDNGGGSFATPAVGKNELSDLVFFQVARTADTKGMVYALNKATGEIVWSYVMGAYGWSSPTIVYTPSGKGYVLVGSSNGMLRLFDGLTGRVVAAADLEDNIEGTPVVFGDTLVLGTRGSRIYGVKVE